MCTDWCVDWRLARFLGSLCGDSCFYCYVVWTVDVPWIDSSRSGRTIFSTISYLVSKISTGYLPDIVSGDHIHLLSMIIGVGITALLIFGQWLTRERRKKNLFEVESTSTFCSKLFSSASFSLAQLMCSLLIRVTRSS